MAPRSRPRSQLCRAELERFRAAAAGGEPITVGCTQEAPLFSEVAGEERRAADLRQHPRDCRLVHRRRARPGRRWRRCSLPPPSRCPIFRFVSSQSEGVSLIYGRDERAIEAGELLKDHLDVTVLITRPKDLTPPRVTDFPVVKGTIRSAKGHLGAFEIVVDDYAAPAPSSRGALTLRRRRATARCRAAISCSTCRAARRCSRPHDLRDGYLRADPGDPAAVLRAVLKARDLVGTFDKPRYITFTEDLCAHSRSKIVGCHRCLDLCPTGAIAPAGDHVAIDRANLRRLRPMRRRLPDRRRGLCVAAGRCADAQAARAAHDLSRGRRRHADRAAA